MKKNNLSTLGFIVLLNFIFVPSNAQLNQVGVFTGAGLEDGKKIISAYMTPFSKSLGNSLSNGWYNTARPHKVLGFDLTFTGSLALVPPDSREFNLDKLGLAADYTDNMAPTFAGKAQSGPELNYLEDPNSSGNYLVSFETPQGTGIPVMFAPTIKAGVGLPLGTEIMGKYMPEIKLGKKGNLGLWGVGLKHDVLQYLGPADKLPFLNLSIMAAYSKLKSNVGISVQPETFNATDNSNYDFDNQALNFEVSNFTSSLLVSADLPIVAFYGGVGLSSSNGNIKLVGDYPLPTIDGSGNVEVTDDSVESDIEIELDESGGVVPRLNVGAKLTFAVVTFHVDYTKTDYSFISTGLGISFR